MTIKVIMSNVQKYFKRLFENLNAWFVGKHNDDIDIKVAGMSRDEPFSCL